MSKEQKHGRALDAESRGHAVSGEGQGELWPDGIIGLEPDTSRLSDFSGECVEGPGAKAPGQPMDSGQVLQPSRKTIQDLLLKEGFLAVQLAAEVDSVEALQGTLAKQLSQNSKETRARYAQSLLRWFFPDGVHGLATRVWVAYRDGTVESDILRYLYLVAEPVVGACVAGPLFPLENGMEVPPDYFDRFLGDHLGEAPPPKTRKRLKSNLMHLGFLARAKGKPDRLCPVASTKTAFLILVHHLFAPTGPRTVEVSRLLSDPFWKYLGYKSEDAVRHVLREADAAGLLGKYVVADQLEQVTTCMTLDEMLVRKVRL